MLAPPTDLRLGEAYIYNDFDIEGEIEATLPLTQYLYERRWGKMEKMRYAGRLLSLPKAGRSLPANVAAKMRGRLHSIDRDRQAIAYHYDDIPNDFFARWLDSRMIYSSAYFAAPDTDLDTARESKLDYVCRKLRLQPGERLLDLGCGWGGLVIYAAQRYGVKVDGVTLSRQQAELARERIRRASGSGRPGWRSAVASLSAIIAKSTNRKDMTSSFLLRWTCMSGRRSYPPSSNVPRDCFVRAAFSSTKALEFTRVRLSSDSISSAVTSGPMSHLCQ